VIGYVAEGSIRFQVKGDTLKVLKAGDTFYEPPDGVHQVSGNASTTQPARLIATFVCDNERPMSTPVK
jgi:quercetin dioxygenase-like cupin family protein